MTGHGRTWTRGRAVDDDAAMRAGSGSGIYRRAGGRRRSRSESSSSIYLHRSRSRDRKRSGRSGRNRKDVSASTPCWTVVYPINSTRNPSEEAHSFRTKDRTKVRKKKEERQTKQQAISLKPDPTRSIPRRRRANADAPRKSQDGPRQVQEQDGGVSNSLSPLYPILSILPALSILSIPPSVRFRSSSLSLSSPPLLPSSPSPPPSSLLSPSPPRRPPPSPRRARRARRACRALGGASAQERKKVSRVRVEVRMDTSTE